MTAGGVSWYLRRLRMMGPQEVVWRTVDAARQQAWRRRQVREPMHGHPPGTRTMRGFPSGLPRTVAAGVPEDVKAATLDAADAVLRGEWDVLGVWRRDIVDPDWFTDEVTGVVAPSTAYAFDINHRDESRVGNIKSLWEVSRHHHLTLLASAWWLSGNDTYAEAVAAQLRSWWAANPFLSGIHWTSGIEIGIRLISWAWIRRLLDEWDGAQGLFEGNDDALWQIWWHQTFLAGFRSRGSSANNHVIAEVAGQLVAANAFSWFAESATWRDRAATVLEDELGRNTFPSGVNRELASDYHRFVTELGLVSAVEAGAAGHPLSSTTWDLLGRSFDAAAALVDSTGRPPRQGDGDDGRVLLLDSPREQGWTRLLGLGEAVLGKAEWWPSGVPSTQSVALAAVTGRRISIAHLPTRPDRFPDAGVTILRTSDRDGAEIWCRCDGGPHGFLSIAAHAHADALSIEVRHDGVDILVDPGTYCYHGEPEWRRYFRSTRGHNTLEVDGHDQSVSGGPFLWVQHATTRPRPTDPVAGGIQVWEAEHDGSNRMSSPVRHRRSVRLDRADRSLSVVDQVDAASQVGVRLSWHLGPDVSVVTSGASASLTWSDGDGQKAAEMFLPDCLTWSVHRGETEPVLGWYSPSFGVRTPTTTLVGVGRAVPSAAMTTTVVFGGAASTSSVRTSVTSV